MQYHFLEALLLILLLSVLSASTRHQYGHERETLEWPARQKIAVGAERGLWYLHEECRVGLRPNNILITHDNEPLVGVFGLARWQPDEQNDMSLVTRAK